MGELLNDIYRPAGLQIDPAVPVYVPDIARYVKGEQNLNSGETTAALDLHARIVYGFKDLAIRHYFLTDVIRRALLSTDQAALVLAIRYRCFANPSTGEVVNRLLVPGGYREMASWIGLTRGKSIWEWLSGYSREVVGQDENKRVSSARTGGIPGFLIDITDLEGDVTRPAKVFRVRMLEPIGFEDSTDDLSWRTWDCDEDWKAYTVAMRQILPKIQRGGGKSPGLAKD